MLRKIPKTSRQWIRSLLFVAALVLFLCSTVSVFILISLKKTLLANTVNTAEFTKNTIDANLLEMQKDVFGLDLHPVTVHIKKINARVDSYTSEYYARADQLQNYKNIHAVIAGIYVHFPNAGIIIGNLGCFSSESYYNLEPHRPISRERPAAITGTGAGFIVSENAGTPQLQYIKPLFYKGKTAGYIVVILNTDELLKYVTKAISSDAHYKAYGMLLNDTVAGSTGSADMIRDGLAHTRAQHHTQLSDAGMLAVPSSFFPDIRYVSFYSCGDLL